MSKFLEDAEITITGGRFIKNGEPTVKSPPFQFPLTLKQISNIPNKLRHPDISLTELHGELRGAHIVIRFDSLGELSDLLEHVDKLLEEHPEFVSEEKLKAALEFSGPVSIDEARYVIDCIDDFDFFVGVEGYEELGKKLLLANIPTEIFDEIEDFTDFGLYGHDYIKNYEFACGFVSNGFIQCKEDYRPFSVIQEMEQCP